MKKLIKRLKRMLRKDYCLRIYARESKTRRVFFGDWPTAVLYAYANTTIAEQYEIEMYRNGRWCWTTGLTIGGTIARKPWKGGIL